MDKQSLHETAKRLALELPFVELCWPFGPEFDVFKIGGKIFMLSSELRGVLRDPLIISPKRNHV
ncbi:hypothetical protein IMP23_17250 [Escherichia coli]|nr:hypothetical protein IMP96_17240 [Escherichia coli]QPF01469.1 hypothetical protein IMP23_17250 [Escherichia coli]